MTRSLRHLIFALTALVLAGCGGGEGEEPPIQGDPTEVPPPAGTERAERDSARVADLVRSYYIYVERNEPMLAYRLFYPDSVPVGTPDGGTLIEGQGIEAMREIGADRDSSGFQRIVLLRSAQKELLKDTYREKWFFRYVTAGPDSAEVERLIHVLQPLGQDTRYLGRMHPEMHPTQP